MKKTLVALAAVAATGAFAQSSVTLYGIFDMSYGTSKTTNRDGSLAMKTSGLHEGTMAGNRIGFRGTEDLGGGMKASFVIEQGISPTNGDLFGNRAGDSGHQIGGMSVTATGTTGAVAAGKLNAGAGAFTTSTNRQSFVGLSGGFGEVRAGYQYTNSYVLSSLSGYIAGPEAAGGDTAHTHGFAGGARANGITYMAPAIGGVKLTVQYSGSGATGGSYSVTTATETSAKRTSVLAQYANGPLSLSAAHSSLKTVTAGVSATAKLTQLGASYNLGVATVVGTYNTGDNGAATPTEFKSHQIGVKVPFGAATLFAAVGSAKSELLGANTADVSQRQLGATYALSKRTNLYFVQGTTKDEGTAIATAAASKGSTTRFGVTHSF